MFIAAGCEPAAFQSVSVNTIISRGPKSRESPTLMGDTGY